jgi:hypothetical protein
MLICLAYFATTFVAPAVLTYRALSTEETKGSETSLWSIYWTFYAVVLLLKCFLPFLQM